MNILLPLDLGMHEDILDIPAPYPLALVRFISQDRPGAKYDHAKFESDQSMIKP